VARGDFRSLTTAGASTNGSGPLWGRLAGGGAQEVFTVEAVREESLLLRISGAAPVAGTERHVEVGDTLPGI